MNSTFSGRRYAAATFSGRRYGGPSSFPPERSVRLSAALFALLLLGCGSESPRLYCGAGIRPPVKELVEEFGRREGVQIVCDYAGSEVLLGRIKLSRHGDLYMPGDVYYVELAEQAGLVASKQDVCYFVPVILVRRDNPKNIRTLEDLTRQDVKVGLGDPKCCAVGRKSVEIFAKNGIPLEDVNAKYWSATVNELSNHIEVGSLDAVIVWDAIAPYAGEEGEIVRIPTDRNVISTVAVGVLKSSKHPELAARFVEFVTSEAAKQVFRKHHYATTRPE